MKTRILLVLFFVGACFAVHPQNAQTPVRGPGGVPGVKAWMETQAVIATQPQDNYRWQDLSGDSIILKTYDARGAAYGTEYRAGRGSVVNYNFNPGVNLGLAGNLEMLLNNTPLSQSTILSVWGPYGEFDGDHFLYNLNGRAGQGGLMTQDFLFQSVESGKPLFDYGSTIGKDLLFHSGLSPEAGISAFQERALRVQTWYRALQPATSIWTEPRYAVITMGGAFYPPNVNNSSTYNITQLRNVMFYGYTPEFIVYDRILNPVDRQKAETYLAVKYGLTLDRSYIGSDGALLWDVDANSAFGNRVTGYGRDDAGGLYQTLSTTSYEEAPYYSGQFAYDTYYLSNSCYESTPYRLLVFGRMKGNAISDRQYLMLGDNGGAFTGSVVGDIDNMKVMSRRWLVNTNIQPVDTADELQWNVQNLTFYKDGFTGSITKPGADATTSGTAVTNVPLQGRDGYFSWVAGTYLGPFTIKFGTQNPSITSGGNDYGYYINYAGAVFPIKGGVQSTSAIYGIAAGQKIEIEKKDSVISLRVNGYRIPLVDIVVAAKDVRSQFYGTVKIDKYWTSDVVMNQFQTGGFADTGDRIELSYVANRASDFYDYRAQGNSFLIIDRSGTGNFDASDVDYIPSTGLDETRSKIIFNNISWNTWKKGKEVFTFGYKLSNISGTVTQIDPACVNDTADANGSISLSMKSGFPGFEYALTPASNANDTVATGAYYTDSLTVNNLAAGTYNLTVQEIGGTNFSARQPDETPTTALSQGYATPGTNLWAECTIYGNNTHASIGIDASGVYVTDPALAVVNYGVRIDGLQLYPIMNGVTGQTAAATISSGDRLRVELVGNTAICRINGVQAFTIDLSQAAKSPFYYKVISLDEGSSPVYNTQTYIPLSWYATSNMRIDVSNGDKMTASVTLDVPDCKEEEELEKSLNGMTPAEANGDSPVAISYPAYPDLSRLKVSVSLDNPSSGQVLLYRISGQLLASVPLANSLKRQDVILNLPHSGVFVIRVITDSAEYTRKVVRK